MDNDVHHRRLLSDADKDRLENAPGFDKDDWPNFGDQSFDDTVRDFYTRR